MKYIKQGTDKEFALPRTFKLDDGSTVTNFDRLTDAERISLAGVFPVADTLVLGVWQTKSLPVYTFSATEATVTYTVADTLLTDYKQQAIAKVYAAAKALLDAQAEGYSAVEVADWPAIQADVAAYNLDNTNIGVAMQAAADSSAYDIAGLSAMITPLIAYKAEVQADRKAKVVAIMAAATHSEV